ncbi:MAG: phenylalanine--tRNA ligase subunit beta [Epsilonproteobacteria bacterium]|nr:phenylalanine--tRNA ligase subunit beta [Campylobacterota bacterium]NPA89358.1 phenylalanine--tRNA ligase subunit beta [Campylobacterota bacterium]
MVVTRKWLEEFVDLRGIETEEILRVLNSIGQEIEGYRKIELPKKVVVGEVIECDRHPNAKKLSVCKVRIGEKREDILQVVCGAPNIGVGQMVPVALPGAVLPNGLEIAKSSIRGIDSLGMVCGALELGLPPIEEGILELDDSLGELKLGKEVGEYLNDEVIELGITPNRGDVLSVYGVARELATALRLRLKPVEKNYKELPEGIGRVVRIFKNEAKYSSNLLKALDGKIESSVKVRLRLALCGLEGRDESDRVLQYAIHATGVLMVLSNRGNITFKNRDGIDIYQAPYGEYLIGIKNDLEYEENGHYILEASYVDPEKISEIVYQKGITDTDDHFYRASRGSEPHLELGVTYFLNEANCNVFTGEYNLVREESEEYRIINVYLSDIWEIIGYQVPEKDVIEILKMLGFGLQAWGNTLRLKIPPYRKDIKTTQDVAEEILRIYGIDKIPAVPLEFKEKNRLTPHFFKLDRYRLLRERAVAEGLYEVVHFAFEERERLEKWNLPTLEPQLDLVNPIVSELDTLRTTHLLQLLDDVALNRANGYKQVSLFTIGLLFDKHRKERDQLALVISGERDYQSPTNSGKPGNYTFKDIVDKIAGIIGEFQLKKGSHPLAHPYQVASIWKNGKEIGRLGRFHPKVEKEWEIGATFFGEIELEKMEWEIPHAKPIIPYPVVTRDLSLVVDKEMSYLEVASTIRELGLERLKLFYPIDLYDLGEKNSLTIRFKLQDRNKTLTEEEINSTMEKILKALEKKGLKLR